MEKIRKADELLEIAEKYYKKLATDLSVDGKLDMAEVVLVLIFVVEKSFGFIFRNHGIKKASGLFGIFINEVTKHIADGIKDNDGADGTESRTISIERGDC